jgi:hypothetical protein
MVCKFAHNSCLHYQKGAVTCDLQNGGPFLASGRGYCGEYNNLSGFKPLSVVIDLDSRGKPILLEA